MDDERLKQMGGGGYWKELLDRIRDIRSSEKVLYRQVLDIYATAVDYDPRSDTSIVVFYRRTIIGRSWECESSSGDGEGRNGISEVPSPYFVAS